MRIAERIAMVAILLILIAGSAWLYFAVTYDQAEVRESVARGDYQIILESSETELEEKDWQVIYPNTVEVFIKDVPVRASVADDLPERIKGLSHTPFLPANVVKLFVFGAYGEHSIWMKDMNYAIDIIWATKEGEIVYLEEDVAPETFPESFASPIPAWYVVEAQAGFVANNQIELGDQIKLP